MRLLEARLILNESCDEGEGVEEYLLRLLQRQLRSFVRWSRRGRRGGGQRARSDKPRGPS